MAVVVGEEDGLAVVAALGDVVGQAGEDDVRNAGMGRMVSGLVRRRVADRSLSREPIGAPATWTVYHLFMLQSL